MSKFTQGEWEMDKEYIFLPNGKWYQPNGFISDEEMQANARLITAAPKMYKLLKAFTECRHEDGMFGLMEDAQELISCIDVEGGEE